MPHFLFRAVTLALVTGMMCAANFTAASAEEPSQDETLTAQVSDTDLSESRGAFVPVTFGFNSVEQSAQDSHNVVIGGTTGMNIISNGSISNTQGLVNVIQNSGNNVIIQSSTTVNMTFNR